MQVEVALEKELRILHLDAQAAEVIWVHIGNNLNIENLKVHSTETQFYQQGHFLFNKVTSSNRVTP